MTGTDSFARVVNRLGAGDDAAAAEVFERFARRLVGLASKRMDPVLRRKVDPEDVVQSVFKSFFARHARGAFDLDGWGALWGLLVVITVRKVGRQARRYKGPEHDARREVAPDGDGAADDLRAALSHEPSPEEAVALTETVDRFLAGLSERERQVAVLRLQGFTVPEISAQVGRTEFTVEGILKKVRKRLHDVLDKEDMT